MASFTGKSPSTWYGDLIQVSNSNSGVDTTTRKLYDGKGNVTAIYLSDDVLKVQPNVDNTTGAFVVNNQGGSAILSVDTTNSLVKAGASQVNTMTLFKEMGLYEFSPNSAGYHYPLIANTMFSQGTEELTYDSAWGNGVDPATSLDVSTLTDPENAIAIYWYIENDITVDSVASLQTCDGSLENLVFHLYSYDINVVGSNSGDLSNGVLCATSPINEASVGIISRSTFTISSANIDAGKVVIGFVEISSSTDDLSVSFNIKYHIR
tara:strand:+ start:362 stop:1156 length:795 start_codon:yes stop_codon:yes gene_type:complete